MNDVVTKVTDSDVQDSANDAGAGNDTIAVQEPAASLSFGAALAAARGALGASVADMAGRMRLHPRQVAALETEQLNLLPEATFVRGFIRLYAKELRLDPAPLLSSFDARVGPATTVKAIGRGPSKLVQAAERERISRQLIILGGVGLLIVLGAIGWLASRRPATAPTPAPAAPTSAVPSTSTSPGSSTTPTVTVTGPVATSGASEPAAERAVGVVPPLAGVAASAAVVAVAPRAEPTDGARPAPAAGPGSPLLRITTGERSSWIEVVQQADGRVVFSGLTEANGERRLLVVPPVRVTVGNATSAKLEYRGKPVDLGPAVRDDVARLTLE